jgi:signal transduction histidine kinase
VKFTERGGEVQLRAGLKNGAVEITVSDTGIGIAPQDLPKAFESFGQIDSRLSRKYEGSGLGLPLARHLAELHGGSLTIESQRGVGTVARLQFPVQRSILTTGENAA